MKKPGICAAVCVLLLLVLCFCVPDGQILWEAGDALYTDSELPAPQWRFLPYGTGLAASAVIAWLVSFALEKKKIGLHGALRWFAWALVLGVVLSRLLYCVIDTAYYNPKWLARLAALRIWDGGMAMTGAVLGMLLACRIVPEGKVIAPAAAPLFIAGARFSEIFTQVGYGPSVYFEGFMARQVGYAVRLNVSVVEGMMALIIFALILLLPRWAKSRKLTLTDGRRVCAFLILYGITQLLMESLRRDRHMIWGFTKAQQIMAILIVLAVLLILSAGKQAKRRTFITTLCAVAPLVGLEFALDRADVPILLLYSAYLIILAAYMTAAYRIFARSLERQA